MQKLTGLIFVLAICSIARAQKVDVTVYYESLCPDSQAFITQQIYPEMKKGLSDHAAIRWIPFGKSTYQSFGSEVNFTCHHGENECYGNKIHACALQHIQVNSYQHDHTRETLILEYINCLMSAGKNFPDSIYPGERCARQTEVLNWDNIAQCANSTEGSQLLLNLGKATQEFQNPLASVPTVTFDEKFDPEVQQKALVNFNRAVCTFIKGPTPAICSSENRATSLSSVGMVFVALLVTLALHNLI